MKYYAVAEIDITDASWVPLYVEHTTALVERYGGRYLARTPSVEKIEGERNPPQIYLLIEWPSKEASEAKAPKSKSLFFNERSREVEKSIGYE